MERPTTSHAEKMPPSLEKLFSSYLAQSESQVPPSRPGQVEPYDSGVSQPTDAVLAWRGALSGLAGLAEQGKAVERPADWATLVHEHTSCPAVAMAAGNYPQLMRDLPGLLQADDLADLLAAPMTVHDFPDLLPWADRAARQSFAGKMLAAGVLRLAGHCEDADRCLREEHNLSKAELQILHNERAVLAWSRGDREAAIRVWACLPVSPVSQFNLGMSKLFTKPEEAGPALESAIKCLNDDDPWRHLAGIYLALAELRS
jgi:hypothetical protein